MVFPPEADCLSVTVVGNWRLVVVSFIHASIEDTSSRDKAIDESLGGGSVVLQDCNKPIKIKSKTTIFWALSLSSNNYWITNTP